MRKRILVIQDYSAVGRCSLAASLPIITACGIDAVGLPTSYFSTQTSKIENFVKVDLTSSIMSSFEHWNSLDIHFDLLYIGYIGSLEGADCCIEIAKIMKKKGIIVVVDPVLSDDGELYSGLNDSYKNKIIQLTQLADIIIPNFAEGKIIADLDLELLPNEENSRMILNILSHKGYKNVLLTGIEKDFKIGTALLTSKKISYQINEKLIASAYGAGDIFASVFVSEYLKTSNYINSSQKAVDFCKLAIDESLKLNIDFRFGLAIEKCMGTLSKD